MKTSFIALSILFAVVSADYYGIDFIQPVSTATFTCLKNNGIHFVIPRVFTSLGTLDWTGIQNVKNAHAGGVPVVDAYLFPCVTARCPSAASQVQSTVNTLRNSGAPVYTLWLDIERLNWPANLGTNRAFIAEMVREAAALNQRIGIYSNYYNWQEIVGLDYTAFSYLPLWWANYNGQLGFQSYRAFGGWASPYVHQYQGTTAGPCGVSVDMNYVP